MKKLATKQAKVFFVSPMQRLLQNSAHSYNIVVVHNVCAQLTIHDTK